MKPRIALQLGSLALLAMMVAGCSRSVDVTVYEPGVYKGAKDPLVAKHATAEHKALLQERLTKSQVDR